MSTRIPKWVLLGSAGFAAGFALYYLLKASKAPAAAPPAATPAAAAATTAAAAPVKMEKKDEKKTEAAPKKVEVEEVEEDEEEGEWEDEEGEAEGVDEETVQAVSDAIKKANIKGVKGSTTEVFVFLPGQKEVINQQRLAVEGTISTKDTAKMEKLAQEIEELAPACEVEISQGLVEGDTAPNSKVYKVADGAQTTIMADGRDKKVLFIDFWATWCGPCQEPMAENSGIWAAKGKDWEGKAEIVAVSIDESAPEVKAHCDKNGWGNITHCWVGPQGKKRTNNASLDYMIRGVPSCYLVKDGKIVWSGHPASIDVEKSIEGLLAGTGVVDKAEEGPAGGDAPAGIPELSKLSEEELLEVLNGLQAIVSDLPEEPFKDVQIICQSKATFAADAETKRERIIVFQGQANAVLEKEFEEKVLKYVASKVCKGILVGINWVTPPADVELINTCRDCKKSLGEGSVRFQSVFSEPAFALCEACEAKADPATNAFFAVPPKAQLKGLNFGKENMQVSEEAIAAGPGPHEGVECDGCSTQFFEGPRFRCAVCLNFDLCETCFKELCKDGMIKHPRHAFLKYAFPEALETREEGHHCDHC